MILMSSAMEINMKKYSYSIVILILIAAITVCVYLVGGMVGAYAWTIALFIAGPLGTVLLLVQLIRLIVKLIKHKSVSTVIASIASSAILAFPILILSGVLFIAYPDNAKSSDALEIEMPVEGAVVSFGGREYKTHAIWPSERYAFDILAEPYDTGDKSLDTYGIYGREVASPVDGEIIDAHDGEEDIEPNSGEFSSSLGNYIFIKVKETGAYMILAHLQKGSVQVNQGDAVKAGVVIAEVGNSGTTSEPHLHIQYQRNDPRKMIFPTCAESLPIIFK